MTGKYDRIRLEILANDSVADLGDIADLHNSSTTDWMAILEGGDPGLTGDIDPDWEMDDFSTQTSVDGSLDFDESSDDEQELGFSHSFDSAQADKKGVMPKEILSFEDHALRWSALAIYQAVQALCRTIDDPEQCTDVAKWLFGKADEADHEQVTFEQCCYAHNARPDIVRLRIMFELWRFGKYANAPLNLGAFDLPDYVFSAIFIEQGVEAQKMANAVWVFPGATREQLAGITSARTLKTMDSLADKYYISPTHGENDPDKQRWYLTGVNPILQGEDIIRPTLSRQRRIELSWAKHFPE